MEINENVSELLSGFMTDLPLSLWRAAIDDFAGAHSLAELDATAASIEALANTVEDDTKLVDALIADGCAHGFTEVSNCRAWLVEVAQCLREKAATLKKRGRRRGPIFSPGKQ